MAFIRSSNIHVFNKRSANLVYLSYFGVVINEVYNRGNKEKKVERWESDQSMARHTYFGQEDAIIIVSIRIAR